MRGIILASRNTRNKRTKIQRVKDLETTANLYLQGVSQYEIAQQLGVSQPQVSLDLKKLRDIWVSRALDHLAQKRAEEVAKCDRFELQLTKFWEVSVEKGEPDLDISREIREWCKKRHELMRLLSPESMRPTAMVIERRVVIVEREEPKAIEAKVIDANPTP